MFPRTCRNKVSSRLVRKKFTTRREQTECKLPPSTKFQIQHVQIFKARFYYLLCSLPQCVGHCFDMARKGEEDIDKKKKTRSPDYTRKKAFLSHIKSSLKFQFVIIKVKEIRNCEGYTALLFIQIF